MVGWTAASIYMIYMAATKQLPWIAPALGILIYAVLAYSFLKVLKQVQ
jgi:hypothetical protein